MLPHLTILILIHYQNYQSVEFRLTPHSFPWWTVILHGRTQTKIRSASQGRLIADGLLSRMEDFSVEKLMDILAEKN